MLFLLLGSFVPYSNTKLGLYSSNLNFRFVSMNELNFFLLTKVLTQNSNIVEFVIFFENNIKTSHSNHINHIEGDIM
jgi:hypothetical protein